MNIDEVFFDSLGQFGQKYQEPRSVTLDRYQTGSSWVQTNLDDSYFRLKNI